MKKIIPALMLFVSLPTWANFERKDVGRERLTSIGVFTPDIKYVTLQHGEVQYSRQWDEYREVYNDLMYITLDANVDPKREYLDQSINITLGLDVIGLDKTKQKLLQLRLLDYPAKPNITFDSGYAIFSFKLKTQKDSTGDLVYPNAVEVKSSIVMLLVELEKKFFLPRETFRSICLDLDLDLGFRSRSAEWALKEADRKHEEIDLKLSNQKQERAKRQKSKKEALNDWSQVKDALENKGPPVQVEAPPVVKQPANSQRKEVLEYKEEPVSELANAPETATVLETTTAPTTATVEMSLEEAPQTPTESYREEVQDKIARINKVQESLHSLPKYIGGTDSARGYALKMRELLSKLVIEKLEVQKNNLKAFLSRIETDRVNTALLTQIPQTLETLRPKIAELKEIISNYSVVKELHLLKDGDETVEYKVHWTKKPKTSDPNKSDMTLLMESISKLVDLGIIQETGIDGYHYYYRIAEREGDTESLSGLSKPDTHGEIFGIVEFVKSRSEELIPTLGY